MNTRTLPLRKITISTRAGADPDSFEDSDQVYASWPEIVERCHRAPAGQCEYTNKDNWIRCIYCGRPSELP